MQQDKNIVYCANRKCEFTLCLRHNVNTPFNVEIKRRAFPVDKDGVCKYKLEEK